MAFSVERAMAKAAAALLPGLLPAPPSMITRFTPSPCIIILPAASNPTFPKPGRADSAERWDVHKKDGKTTKPRSAASSFGSSSSPGRADSCQRWDMNKIEKNASGSSSSSSPMSIQGSSERYKRPPSRASSADRWDTHKKPRDALSHAESRSRTSEDKEQQQKDETTEMAPRTHPVFSGPTFVASPEPSMLPMPAFFPRRVGVLPLPAFVQAH